jgi:hypothetical protein
MKNIFLVALSLLFSNNSFSQQQWKFYVAFEEGSGQRDTLWMIWDTTATVNVDTGLGEGSAIYDYAKFNVWIYNSNFDSTKTLALPYIYFPHHTLADIYAFNFTYPITITWDTSLFHANYLPVQSNNYINEAKIDNDFFFFVNNDMALHAYNMLLTDSAFAPQFNWGSQSHFPMTITITYDPILGIDEFVTERLNIYPNPVLNEINFSNLQKLRSIAIYNSQGMLLKKLNPFDNKLLQVFVGDFPIGVYFIIAENTDNTFSNYSFIKH